MAFWAVAAVLTTAYTYDQQKKAAKAAKEEIEQQAELEKIAAVDEEIMRRQKLNRVLASQIASQATSISGEGTPASIALASAENISYSEAAEDLTDRMRQDLLKRKARNTYAVGSTQATSTLLSNAYSAYQLR